jgi:hypothetical protein
MGDMKLGRGGVLLAVCLWLLIVASGLVCATSYFVPYPPAVVDVSLAVLCGVIVVGTVACFRRARRAGMSFFRAVRLSAREAWSIAWALF